jgi:hypothetical protein
MRNLNERMSFTGGAEVTPTVSVVHFRCPGSLNNNQPSLRIEQEDQAVTVSPETLRAILKWYRESPEKEAV